MRVRVRGICSTAITKVLLDEGFQVSHTSEKIRERFSLEETRDPPDVTVKDTDPRHGLVIVGDYDCGKRVFEVLKSRFDGSICWVSKLPLHSIIKGEVVEAENGSSVVNLGRYRGVIDRELEVGREILVDVSRPFLPSDDLARLSTNYTIFGRYVALIHDLQKKVIFSRHIADSKLRQDLMKLTALSKVRGWCVKWRSSAAIGDFGEMIKDLQDTYKRAEEVMEEGERAEVGEIVYRGQFFAIIGFDKRAKRALDEVRNGVLPTIQNHHSLKSMNEGEVVDYSEHILRMNIGGRERISEAAMSYIASLMREQGLVHIEHISILSGEIKRLTPGRVVDSRGDVYVLKRAFRGGGFLDGLDVRKEPGDYDLMEFSPELPLILHKYHGRAGELKGIYVNLNSPPEISRSGIRYFDVEIDVVASQNEVKILDEEKLEKAHNLGIISGDMKEAFSSIAKNVQERLSRIRDLNDVSLEDLKACSKHQTISRLQAGRDQAV